MNLLSFFKLRIERFELIGKLLKRRIIFIAYFRLVVFLLAAFFLYMAISLQLNLLFIVTVLLVILFIILVNFHKNLNDRYKKNITLVHINETEISVLNDDFSSLPDGSEFLDPEHDFSYDLDIFGKNSLFQYINRTCTKSGSKKLASLLCIPELSIKKIHEIQNRNIELSRDIEFLQDFLSTGSFVSEKPEEIRELIEWSSEKEAILPSWVNIYSFFTSILSVLIILSALAGFDSLRYFIPAGILNWMIYGLYWLKINHYHMRISRKTDLIGKYLQLNRIIASKDFNHSELYEINNVARNSLLQINKLHRLINFLDQRLNVFVGLTLNTLFLFDIHILRSLENWKKLNSSHIPKWLDVPPTMDAWLSMGNFVITHPDFSWPVPVKSGIETKSISHPLLPPSIRITNDFAICPDKKLCIITGANMAGKSTFLRILGINMQMAMIGLPVCAKSMKFTPSEIHTGMRTNDSLAENESYFLAELRRLKTIIEKLNKGKNLFILLDEILKGTNSTDKHTGSIAFIEQLILYPCITFIASHDLSLGRLEKNHPGEIMNICFESFIEGDALKFDYKIRQGLAQNMNATFLMQKMGIIRKT